MEKEGSIGRLGDSEEVKGCIERREGERGSERPHVIGKGGRNKK